MVGTINEFGVQMEVQDEKAYLGARIATLKILSKILESQKYDQEVTFIKARMESSETMLGWEIHTDGSLKYQGQMFVLSDDSLRENVLKEFHHSVRKVTYRLALPPQLAAVYNVFHISMLRKYEPHPSHVINWGDIDLNEDANFEKRPIKIMDRREKDLEAKLSTWCKCYGSIKEWSSLLGKERMQYEATTLICLKIKPQQGSPMVKFQAKLKRLKLILRQLNKDHCSNISTRVVEARHPTFFDDITARLLPVIPLIIYRLIENDATDFADRVLQLFSTFLHYYPLNFTFVHDILSYFYGHLPGKLILRILNVLDLKKIPFSESFPQHINSSNAANCPPLDYFATLLLGIVNNVIPPLNNSSKTVSLGDASSNSLRTHKNSATSQPGPTNASEGQKAFYQIQDPGTHTQLMLETAVIEILSLPVSASQIVSSLVQIVVHIQPTLIQSSNCIQFLTQILTINNQGTEILKDGVFLEPNWNFTTPEMYPTFFDDITARLLPVIPLIIYRLIENDATDFADRVLQLFSTFLHYYPLNFTFVRDILAYFYGHLPGKLILRILNVLDLKKHINSSNAAICPPLDYLATLLLGIVNNVIPPLNNSSKTVSLGDASSNSLRARKNSATSQPGPTNASEGQKAFYQIQDPGTHTQLMLETAVIEIFSLPVSASQIVSSLVQIVVHIQPTLIQSSNGLDGAPNGVGQGSVLPTSPSGGSTDSLNASRPTPSVSGINTSNFVSRSGYTCQQLSCLLIQACGLLLAQLPTDFHIQLYMEASRLIKESWWLTDGKRSFGELDSAVGYALLDPTWAAQDNTSTAIGMCLITLVLY
ncbi:uncharacterized protein LOC114311533 [Camellia sinensis]|uniref:uncharacterized protein LOC114311533 n=1 Tax=Camellia sinensis TaxID=4442 RepID=UPI0010357E54|nr:uncharacterized protein LOC114311533 [Camellia sinensis]